MIKPVNGEEEREKLERKYINIMKEALKEFKNDQWKRRKAYCLHGDQKKIEEVIWRLTVSARKLGLEVVNLLKDYEAWEKLRQAYLGSKEASVWASDKVFIVRMSDIPESWDHTILRGHIGGYWLIICDRSETDCCIDYHFYFR